MYKKLTLASIFTLLFVACGGGGSSSTADNNTSSSTSQPTEQNLTDSQFKQSIVEQLAQEKGVTIEIASLLSTTTQKRTQNQIQKSVTLNSSTLVRTNGRELWIENSGASRVVASMGEQTKEIILTTDNSQAEPLQTNADTQVFVTQCATPSKLQALVNISYDSDLTNEQNIQNAADEIYEVIETSIPNVVGIGADFDQAVYLGEGKSVNVLTPNGGILLNLLTPNGEIIELNQESNNTNLTLDTTQEGNYTVTIPTASANRTDTPIGSYEVTKNPLFPIKLKLVTTDLNVSSDTPYLTFEGTPLNRVVVTYELQEKEETQKQTKVITKLERKYATFNSRGDVSLRLYLNRDGSYLVRYHQEATDPNTGETVAQADESFVMYRYTPQNVGGSTGEALRVGVEEMEVDEMNSFCRCDRVARPNLIGIGLKPTLQFLQRLRRVNILII